MMLLMLRWRPWRSLEWSVRLELEFEGRAKIVDCSFEKSRTEIADARFGNETKSLLPGHLFLIPVVTKQLE